MFYPGLDGIFDWRAQFHTEMIQAFSMFCQNLQQEQDVLKMWNSDAQVATKST